MSHDADWSKRLEGRGTLLLQMWAPLRSVENALHSKHWQRELLTCGPALHQWLNSDAELRSLLQTIDRRRQANDEGTPFIARAEAVRTALRRCHQRLIALTREAALAQQILELEQQVLKQAQSLKGYQRSAIASFAVHEGLPEVQVLRGVMTLAQQRPSQPIQEHLQDYTRLHEALRALQQRWDVLQLPAAQWRSLTRGRGLLAPETKLQQRWHDELTRFVSANISTLVPEDAELVPLAAWLHTGAAETLETPRRSAFSLSYWLVHPRASRPPVETFQQWARDVEAAHVSEAALLLGALSARLQGEQRRSNVAPVYRSAARVEPFAAPRSLVEAVERLTRS